MMLRLLIIIISLLGPVLCAFDLGKGMDNVLFKPFCARDLVKNMMKECYLAPLEAEINYFGSDAYSSAESGTVTFREGNFSPTGNQRATSFRIVSKGTVQVTCQARFPKNTADETDYVKVVPVAQDGYQMNFGDVISSEASDFERTGYFVNGAVIYYRSDVHFVCNWLTVDN